jgi:hypothetical protein
LKKERKQTPAVQLLLPLNRAKEKEKETEEDLAVIFPHERVAKRKL